jgi:uncharacterized membrane protein YwzB
MEVLQQYLTHVTLVILFYAVNYYQAQSIHFNRVRRTNTGNLNALRLFMPHII